MEQIPLSGLFSVCGKGEGGGELPAVPKPTPPDLVREHENKFDFPPTPHLNFSSKAVYFTSLPNPPPSLLGGNSICSLSLFLSLLLPSFSVCISFATAFFALGKPRCVRPFLLASIFFLFRFPHLLSFCRHMFRKRKKLARFREVCANHQGGEGEWQKLFFEKIIAGITSREIFFKEKMCSRTTDWRIYRLSFSLPRGRGMEMVPSQLIWPLLIYLVPARKERREERGLAPIISLQRVLSIVGRSVRFPNTNEEKNSTGNKFSGNSIYLYLNSFL